GAAAVADDYRPAAERVAEKYGIKCCDTGEEVIALPEVDAVVITSTDDTHAHYILEGLKKGKFVFCEKPMAENVKDCEDIIAAEQRTGRKLVQIGFMRHYDKGYAEMKRIIESGKLGAPLMIHESHRNVSQPPTFQRDDQAITNIAIHELDISRWLLGEEYDTAQVLTVRQTSNTKGWKNPQLIILTTESQQRVTLEIQTSESYAYDIQCEVVCENGVINLPDPSAVKTRANANCSFPVLTDWQDRFIEAYDIEFCDWVSSILTKGEPAGPSAWDGYVACKTADALMRSRISGVPEKVDTIEKPEMYK
ncbi:MAG: Gfo/Idh/MocA family oxidoreductase, partial [Parasporobacterium sp.]|nr:Gfo/Idh/MocA family oxidoreductase [Parasporobacterium sp.]